MNLVLKTDSTEITNLTTPESMAAASRIHGIDKAKQIAARVKNEGAYENAVVQQLEAQRDFYVDEYSPRFPKGGDGSNQHQRKSARTGAFADDGQEADTWCKAHGFSRRTVQRWGELADSEQFIVAKHKALKKCWGAVANWGNAQRGASGTGENEWYTPEQHLVLARKVLGGIDLDPASSEVANRTVQAGKFFSEEDDGLQQPWFGRVWLNPPYAQPAIALFAEKMAEEWTAGNVEAAIVLTHNYTDTAWFQLLASCATALCFTRGRVRFVSPEGELAAPTQGQCFFYFGKELDIFVDVFGEVGFVAEVRR